MQIQIFLLTFPVCVPNTGDNDVMYLKRIKLTLKTEKETQCLELIVLVNRCKIYVYINNKTVILLLMAIYNKNQATVPLVKIIPKIASGCQTKRMTCLSLIQVCSNGGATYIIDKIIAKNNLNIGYLMQNL